MLQTPLAKISTLLALAIVVWALSAGRRPERLAAAAIGGDWGLSILLQDHRPFHHLQPAIFGLDALQAMALLWVALCWRRTWTLWACAFALLLLFMHVTVLVDPRIMQWSYLTVSYVWSFGLLAALGAGMQFERASPLQRVRWASLAHA